MKKNSFILTATALVLTLAAFKVISAEEAASVKAESKEVKSVAWYVANVKEAKAKNQLCHDNPGKLPSEDCENSLHALQISFKGGN